MTHRIVVRSEGKDPITLLFDGLPVDARKIELRRHGPPFFRNRDSSAPLHHWPAGLWTCHIRDKGLAAELLKLRFEEIWPSFAIFSVPCDADWPPFVVRAYFMAPEKDGVLGTIVFEMRIMPEQWSNPYTIPEFESSLLLAAQSSTKVREEADLWDIHFYDYNEDDDNDRGGSYWELGLALPIEDVGSAIGDELRRCADLLREFISSAVRSILRSRRDALVTFFDFPDSIRSVGEQYLLYFIQFLEDLGVKADAELSNRDGSVLFSVVPKDGPSALVEIKEALEIYLQLPASTEFLRLASERHDIAIMQLRANVLFLQSQLELARAVIEAKNSTIQNLNLVTFQQNQTLVGPSASHAEKEEEPLIGRAVTVTKYEGKGFSVNLPLILRKLKRALSN